MRHQKAGRKFGRNTSHRRAMFRNLAGNLVLHERIQTTDAKAKELRRIAERLVTKAVRLGDDLTKDVSKLKDETERDRILAQRVHVRREVGEFLPKQLAKTHRDGSVEEVDIVQKLLTEIAPRYLKRAKAGNGGGYTRVIKVNRRRGDNAPMSLIEFLGSEAVPVKERKKKAAPPEMAEGDAEQA